MYCCTSEASKLSSKLSTARTAGRRVYTDMLVLYLIYYSLLLFIIYYSLLLFITLLNQIIFLHRNLRIPYNFHKWIYTQLYHFIQYDLRNSLLACFCILQNSQKRLFHSSYRQILNRQMNNGNWFLLMNFQNSHGNSQI